MILSIDSCPYFASVPAEWRQIHRSGPSFKPSIKSERSELLPVRRVLFIQNRPRHPEYDEGGFDAFRCFELKIALAGRKTPVRRRKNRFIFRFKYCTPVLISRSVIYSSILRHIMRRKFPKRFFRLFFRSKKSAPIRQNILNWHPVKAGTFVKREDIRPQAFSLKNLKTGSRT